MVHKGKQNTDGATTRIQKHFINFFLKLCSLKRQHDFLKCNLERLDSLATAVGLCEAWLHGDDHLDLY